MKLCGWAVIVLLLVSGSAHAQIRSGARSNNSRNQSDDGPLSKFYFAGGGGFGTGTSGYGRYTFYSLSPVVGYKVTPEFMTGVWFTYSHSGFPDLGQSLNQYGVGPFMRYNFNQVFFQVEYDYISSPTISSSGTLDNNQFFSRLLFGIGYSMPVGQGRSALNAMAMYDVLYRTPSVFNSPIVVRVFFSF